MELYTITEGSPYPAGNRVFFTDFERRLLNNLVEKNMELIESKKNDWTSIKKKNEAWHHIELEFNSFAESTTRSAKQLKKCWENQKARNKKLAAMAKEKEEWIQYQLSEGIGMPRPPIEGSTAVAHNETGVESEHMSAAGAGMAVKEEPVWIEEEDNMDDTDSKEGSTSTAGIIEHGQYM